MGDTGLLFCDRYRIRVSVVLLCSYKIIGSTKHGNYRLENRDGTELKQAFVPERLKNVAHDLIEEDANAHVEVEKILGHRKRKNRFEYLVKWAKQPESENSWEPEGHLQ